MNSKSIRAAAVAALGIVVPTAIAGIPAAQAHVTLENAEAPADSFYKAAFKVPHGCEGTATVTVRIQIPDGVTNVKPQQKAGWQLAVVKMPVNPPVEGPHGSKITETIREVSWSGGRLLDENYDEFWVQVRLPDRPGATLYFPVVQQCEKGMHRWIEASGTRQIVARFEGACSAASLEAEDVMTKAREFVHSRATGRCR